MSTKDAEKKIRPSDILTPIDIQEIQRLYGMTVKE